jgi:hypothetical protein
MLFRISNLHEKLNHSTMKRIKLLFFAVGLFYFGQVNGQGVNLRVDTNALNGIGTIYHDSTITVPILLHNDSSFGFSFVLSMGSSINGVLNDSIDSLPGEAIYYSNSGFSDTIGPHEAITRNLVITGVNPPFIQGPNGLVVWPKVLQSSRPVLISDSASTVLNFQFPAAINEPNDKNLKVYVVGQQLLIKGDGEHLLKSAALYDVTGNAVHQQSVTINGVVNMEPYAEGIYFAEITFADNTRQVFKVLNTR